MFTNLAIPNRGTTLNVHGCVCKWGRPGSKYLPENVIVIPQQNGNQKVGDKTNEMALFLQAKQLQENMDVYSVYGHYLKKEEVATTSI